MDPLRSKNLISTKDASELSGYSPDYLSRLARSGKILGSQVGRTWVVDEKSLVRFMAAQEKHKKQLALALARERASEYKRAAKPEPIAVVPVVLPAVAAPVAGFITTKAASEQSGYSADYLAKLAREGKIRGEQIGRQWFVHEATLSAFIEATEDRKVELARELARERVRDLRDATRSSLFSFPFFGSRAAVTAILVVVVFASAYGIPALFSPTSVGAAARASGAENSFEEIALKTYTTLHSWFIEVRTRTFAYWKPSNRVIVISMPGFAHETAASATTTPHTVVASGDGITETELTRRLQTFRQSLLNEIPNVPGTTINNNYFDIRRTSYTRESEATGSGSVTSVDISGGTTGFSFSGGPVTDTGTFTMSGVLSVSNGGTGTSTAPTYGKVLLGNSAGGYDLVATTSLGITAGSAGWGSIVGTLSDQTDLQNALDAKLSLSSWYATTTDGLDEGATNLYYTDARVATYVDTIAKGYFFSTTSADYWKTQRDFFSTTSANYWVTQTGIESLSDVASMTETWGDLLYWNGTAWTNIATSSLGITGTGGSVAWGSITGTLSDQTDLQNALNAKLSLSSWYATTTDGLDEGATNLYYTDGRVGTYLSALDKGFFFSTTSANFWKTLTDFFSTTSAQYFVHSSTTIPKTYTANTFTDLQTIANASTTFLSVSGELYTPVAATRVLFSSTNGRTLGSANFTFNSTDSRLTVTSASTTNFSTSYASSTSAFLGSLSVGSLSGPLQAINGSVSATSTLSVAYGGTGVSTAPSYGQVLLGNSSGGYALTATSSLGLGTVASIGPTGQAQTGPAITIATSTSAFNGLTPNLTVTGAGNTLTYTSSLSGSLADAGVDNNLTISGGTIENTPIGASTASTAVFTNATSTSATTTNQYVSGAFRGAGLTTCSAAGDKLLWNSTTGQFSCGADAGAGGGITAIGAQYSSFQSGSSQTLATTSDTNIGLVITSSGDTHTFTPTWSGSLAVARGGTGSTTLTGILKGNGTGSVQTAVAGTDYIASVTGDWTGTFDGQEGSYYLANSFSTTSADYWKTQRNFFSTTSADYWITQTSIESLSDVAAMTENYGDLLGWNGSSWTDFATSSLGLPTFSSLDSYLTLSAWYATTTDGLDEGLTNLYYTDARVNSYINASTTVPKTYVANTFTALQTFGSASSTYFSSSYASSTNALFGSLSIDSLTGPLQAISGVVSATSSISQAFGGTGINSYTAGDILYADSNGTLAKLPIGVAGRVLKVVGGLPSWQTDLTSGGGGGAGAWSTTTDDLAIYPTDTSDVVIVGAAATSTSNSVLEVFGRSYFSNTIGIATTAPSSAYKLSVQGDALFSGSAYLANLTATGTVTTLSFLATNATTTSLGINSETFTDLTGTGLQNVAGALTLNATGDWTGTFDGQEGSYYLANSFSTTSADYWKTQRNFFSTTSADYWITQTSIESLSDVAAMTENYGDLLFWNGSAWADIATSSLGLPTLSDLGNYLSLSAWYATTTDGLDEGLTNLYWTNTRFDNRLSATTTLPNLTTLANLTTVGTIGAGVWQGTAIANAYVADDLTISGGTINNTSIGATTPSTAVFTNATSTSATTTNLYASGVTRLGSLTGPLQATSGVVSATGTVSVAYGGTGQNAFTANALLLGNGTGALATTSSGTNGYVLALVSGVPTWVATTSINNGVTSIAQTYGSAQTGAITLATSTTGTDFSITNSSGAFTFNLPTASASARGALSSTDWSTFNNKISSSSLSATYPLAYNSSTGVFTTALSTTTSQSWSGTNTFNGNTVLTHATATSLYATTLGANNEYLTDFTGNGLTITSGALSVSTTSLSSGFFLQNGNSFGATAVLGTNDAQNLQFETGGTSRMTLLSTGEVGIGTSTPSALSGLAGALLQVGGAATNGYGNLVFAGGTATGQRLGVISFQSDGEQARIESNNVNGTNDRGNLAFYTSNSVGGIAERVRITETGLVGVGTTTPNANAILATAGSAYIGGNLTATGTLNVSGVTTLASSLSGLLYATAGVVSNATLTANDFNDTAGTIAIDYTNGQAASASTKGFLTSTDWSTFNNKISSTSIDTSAELASLVTDETGSGALVLADTPSLTTPSIAGATLSGTLSGSPTFSGTPLFTGGFVSSASSTITKLIATEATTTSLAISGLTVNPTNGSLLYANTQKQVQSAAFTSPLTFAAGTLSIDFDDSATITYDDLSYNFNLNLSNANTWLALQTFSAGANITGGALSGTFTGSPTFSGTPVFTGGIVVNAASSTISNLNIGTLTGSLYASSGSVAATTTLGAHYGGTGLSSYTTGDLLYASGAATLSKLADVATGNALISGGVGVAPSWGKIGLTTHVSGTLPVTSGGTGWGNIQANAVVIGNGTSALATTSAGTNGQVLALVSGVPTWVATSSINNGVTSIAQTYGSAQTGAITLATSTTGTDFSITNSSGAFTFNLPTASASARGALSSTDWSTFNNKISSSSLSATYPLAYNSSTGVFTTALSTTTSQSWSGTNTFNGNVTLTNATSSTFGITSLTLGRVPFATTSGALIDSSAFTFDSATSRLTATNLTSTNASTTYLTSSQGVQFGTTGGNVGIGTTSPFSKLSVGGSAYIGGNLTATGTLNVSGATTLASSLTGLLYSTAGVVSNATLTAADFNDTAGTIAIDYTNGQAASASTKGFLTSADWTSFNNRLSTTSIDLSSELAGVVTDETGSGALVFGTNASLASTTLTGNTALHNATSSIGFYTPNFGINSEYITDLTGNGLTITSGALSVSTTSLSSGFFLQNGNSFGATAVLGTNDAQNLNFEIGGTSETLLTSTAFSPNANDGSALGTTALGWSDLHLATGGVINWANGEVTLTETDANTLTVAGATAVSLGTSAAFTTGTIELGAAADTTLSRSAAGILAVEGVDQVNLSASQTLTNKSLTSPTITGSPTAAGATWTNLGTVTTADINGGTLDGVVIGGASAAAGTFTSLTATGATTLAGFLSTASSTINANATTTGTQGVGALYINNERFTDLTGNGLTLSNGALTVSTSSLSSGFFLQDGNSFGATAVLGTNDSQNLQFETAGSPRMTIDTSGNVGIGTTTPDSVLNLVGADPILLIKDTETSGTVANSRIRFAESTAGGVTDNYWDLGFGIAGTSAIDFSLNRSGTSYLTVKSSGGNVGIGTTTPDEEFVVSGSSITRAVVETTASADPAYVLRHPNQAWAIGIDNSNSRALSFSASETIGSSEAMVITAAGLVGIGTTSPFSKLSVGGSAYIGGTITATSTITGTAFIPTGSASGESLYLPAASTLGLSIGGTGEAQLTSTAFSPFADGGNSLGTTALGWQNLFLNTGATINIENGNWLATHTSGILTVGTGDLRVTTAGTNSASVVTVGGTQTLTNKSLTSPTITGSPTAAGATWTNLGTVTTADINGGTLDGVVIGGSSPAAATTTSLAINTLSSALVMANATGGIIEAVAGTDYIAGGTGSANQVAYFSGTGALAGDADLTWNGTTLTAAAGATLDLNSTSLSIADTDVTFDGATTNFNVTGDFSIETSQFLVDISTGFIGIGDATPSQMLDIDGTDPQMLTEESTTEFLRAGVGETAGTSIIGWDDADALQLGVYSSPTDTTINPFVTVTSAGLVGIGTSSPSGTLDVWSTGGRYASFATNGRNIFSANDNTVTPVLTLQNTMETAGHGASLVFNLGYGGNGNTQGTAVTSGRIYTVAENSYTSTASTQDASLVFDTALNGSLTEEMRITSAGFVGIGTSTPGYQLQVAANNSGLAPQLALTGSTNANVGVSLGYNTAGSVGVLGAFSSISGLTGTSMLINPVGGNVGIGTTSPFAALSVGGSAYIGGTITSTSTITGTAFIPTGSASGESLYLPAASTLGLSIGGTGEAQLTSTAFSPFADGGNSLGTTALGWQNLFLNTGATINIENGNWLATHTSGILTVGTGDLRVTTAGTNSASVVTVGGTQTLTSKSLTSPTITGSPTASGATWTSLGTVTTADINGGTLDGVLIGGASPAAATTTSLAINTLSSELLKANATGGIIEAVAGTDYIAGGTGSANQVAYFSGTGVLTSDANFTYDGTTLVSLGDSVDSFTAGRSASQNLTISGSAGGNVLTSYSADNNAKGLIIEATTDASDTAPSAGNNSIILRVRGVTGLTVGDDSSVAIPTDLAVDTNTLFVDASANAVGLGTSTPGYALTVGGALMIDHSNATYDVWIQGGYDSSGDARNLALLGNATSDDLILNYNTEYDCVSVGGTSCSEALDVTGTGQFSGALDAASLTLTTELAVAEGGTGATTLTDGGILLGSGTGAVTAMAVLGNGAIVVGDGTTDPVALTAFTSSTGDLIHEAGGLEADVSGYTNGLYGQLSGATADIDTESELETALGGIDITDSTDIDTCAEFIVLVAAFDTGTCGNLVFSASPTLTGTVNAAAITMTGDLTVDTSTLFVDATGNEVGIGTASPNETLHVAGDALFGSLATYDAPVSANSFVHIGSNAAGATTPNGELILGHVSSAVLDDVLGQISFYSSDASTNGTGRQAAIKAMSENAGGTIAGLAFFTGNGTNDSSVERLRIDNAGTVGIGTSTPDGSGLHVFNGESNTTVSATADDLIIEGSTNAGLSILTPDASQSTIYFGSPTDSIGAQLVWTYDSDLLTLESHKTGAELSLGSGNGVEAVRIDSSGDVGIGTTSPNQALTIFRSGADAAIEFSTITGGNEKWTIGIDDSDAAKFKIASSSALGTSDRLVIDGAGHVGIASSSPSGNHFLAVGGGAYIGGDLVATGTLSVSGATTMLGLLNVIGIESSNGIEVGPDSAASPNYAWLTDTTSGMYSTAPGVGFSVSGTGEVTLSSTSFAPVTNDGNALGTTALGWADLHLATGGVINWANGEVTLTETDANTLTVAGATAVSLGTSAAFTTGTIELGAAADTTLSRSAAGILAVEGVDQVNLSTIQTLTNKTLTSPTINSGALSGTFTGAPTFSGNITFSGTPLFSTGLVLNSASSTFAGTTLDINSTGLSIADTDIAFDGASTNFSFTGNYTINGGHLVVDKTTANIGIASSTPFARLAITSTTTDIALGIEGGNIIHYASSTPHVAGSVADSTNFDDPRGPSVVLGNYLYATSFTGDRFTVFDVSSSTAPQVVASITSATQLDGASGIAVGGRYAYVTSFQDNMLTVVDISSPKVPIVVGTLTDATNFSGPFYVQVAGNYAYVSARTGGRFTVVDISNPTAPFVVSSITSANLALAWGIQVVGKYAYVMGANANTLNVIDISNPASPTIVGSLTDATLLAGGMDLAVSGRYAYTVSSTTGAFTVVDISVPTAPTIAGSFTDATRLGGTANVPAGIAVAGRYVYVSGSGNDYVNVMDVSDASLPKRVTSYQNSSFSDNVVGLTVVGKYLYASARIDDMLTVFDINGTETPTLFAGAVYTDTLSSATNLLVGTDVTVGGSVNVGLGGIMSRGGLTVQAASTTATSVAARFLGGFVGIGTTTPRFALHVAATSSPQIALSDGSTASNIWTLRSISGNLLFATSSPTTYATSTASAISINTNSQFSVNNLVSCAGVQTNAAGTMSCTSDASQKDISGAFTTGLDAIMRISPQTYSWKASSTLYDGGVQYSGFIAQDVEAAIPEAVNTGYGGVKQISTTAILAASVNAIKDIASGYTLKNLGSGATSTIASYYQGTTTAAVSIASGGNVAIGTSTNSLYKLSVGGDIAATGYVNLSTETSKTDIEYLSASTTEGILADIDDVRIATYHYKSENPENPLRLGLIAESAPREVLSVDGKGVDIYKLATYSLAGVQALSDRVTMTNARVDSLEERIKRLEDGSITVASGSPLTFSTSTLVAALESLGVSIRDGVLAVGTLVSDRFVVAADDEGSAAAGSGIILEGNIAVEIENTRVASTSRIFITMTSPLYGGWSVTDKEDGSFRVTLEKAQEEDITFDYLIVETEGVIRDDEGNQIEADEEPEDEVEEESPSEEPPPEEPPTQTPQEEEPPSDDNEETPQAESESEAGGESGSEDGGEGAPESGGEGSGGESSGGGEGGSESGGESSGGSTGGEGGESGGGEGGGV